MPGRGTQGIRFSRVRFDNPALFTTYWIRAQGHTDPDATGPQTVKAWYRNADVEPPEDPFATNSLTGVLVTRTGGAPAVIGVPTTFGLGTIVYLEGAVHSFWLTHELGIENSAATATLELRDSDGAVLKTWTHSDSGYYAYDYLTVVPRLKGAARDEYSLYLKTSNVLYAARVKNIRLLAFDECVFPGKDAGAWWA